LVASDRAPVRFRLVPTGGAWPRSRPARGARWATRPAKRRFPGRPDPTADRPAPIPARTTSRCRPGDN